MLKKSLYKTWNKELCSLPEQTKAPYSGWESEEGGIPILLVFEEGLETAYFCCIS